MRIGAWLCGAIVAIPGLAAPPGSAPADLRFETDGVTLSWSPLPDADAYNVYRGMSQAAADQACWILRTPVPSASVPEVNGAGLRKVDVAGAVVTLTLDHRLQGAACGVPVPAFREIAIP